MAMEMREPASGVNRNVGVVGRKIVEGTGVAYVATSARVRIVVPGEIVEREGKPVQGCQQNDNSNVQLTHVYSICPFFLLLIPIAD